MEAKERTAALWTKFEKDNATLLLNLDKSTARLIFVHGFAAGLSAATEIMAEMRQSVWGPQKVVDNG